MKLKALKARLVEPRRGGRVRSGVAQAGVLVRGSQAQADVSEPAGDCDFEMGWDRSGRESGRERGWVQMSTRARA